MSVQIVHLSDLHFDDEPDSRNDNDWALNKAGARFEALAKFIDSEYPKSHIAITGDITDSGTMAQYQLAERLLGPWLQSGKLSVVPGNHDCGTYGLHFNEERWTTFYRTFGTAVKRIDCDLDTVFGQWFIFDDVEIPWRLVVRQPRRYIDGDREGQPIAIIHGRRPYFDIRAELENRALHPDAIDADAVVVILLGGAPAKTKSVFDGIVEGHAAAIVENAEALRGNVYGYRIFREIRFFGKTDRPAAGTAPCAVNAVID